MAMRKKKYWPAIYFFLFFLIFLLYIVDMRNKISYVIQSKDKKIILINKINDNKKQIIDSMYKQSQSLLKLDSNLLDTQIIILYLTKIFSAQNVSVSSIQILKTKIMDGMSILPIKVSLSGQFSDLSKSIISLVIGPKLIAISDFSFQYNKNGEVNAQLQLFVFGIHANAAHLDDDKSKMTDAIFLEKTTHLSQMRWGGFYHDKENSLAFLILPDGLTIEVRAGMTLGLEKGKVIDVLENGITINIAGKVVKIRKNEN